MIKFFCLLLILQSCFSTLLKNNISQKKLSCSNGWSWASVREQCIYIQDTQKNKAAAEQYCNQQGGHLVSISSQFDNSEIICAQKAENGSYSWSDGHSFNFNDFDKNDQGNDQSECVVIDSDSGLWNKVRCNFLNCFICEGPENNGSSINATDCNDLKNQGVTTSGIHDITLNGKIYSVYCDMDTEEGGWTVIQQRVNSSLTFWNQTWNSYKNGFGTVGEKNNFWAGNELLHLLTTKDEKVVLRVDLWGDRDPGSNHVDDYWFAEYILKVDNESLDYSLHIQTKRLHPDNHSDWTTVGNATTGWFDLTCSDGIKFSTVDRINDPMKECVTDYQLGGWWLHYCALASLNGAYIPPISYGNGYGFMWTIDGYYIINPEKSKMSIRPGKKTKIRG